MQNTCKTLEAQCTATINHNAPDLRTYQCAGRENTEPHSLTGRKKPKLLLMMLRKAREACCLGRTSHNPRTTSTELPPCYYSDPRAGMFLLHQNLTKKEGQQKQKANSILQRYDGGSPPAPCSSCTIHLRLPLPTHRHMGGFSLHSVTSLHHDPVSVLGTRKAAFLILSRIWV